MHKIGVIAADPKDFINFCKAYGFSLGSELVVNLIDYKRANETPLACIYVTMKAQAERKDFRSIRDLFLDSIKLNTHIAINLCESE